MPTYDYECEKGHRFEAFQSMKDEPLRECRECGAPVRRLIGPGSGFIFKGGGFYITDYRSKDYKEKAKSESKPAESGSKAESKSAESGSKSESKSSSADKASGSSSSGGSDKSSDTGGPGKSSPKG
jgi:putative FmdB family regulatory protein